MAKFERKPNSGALFINNRKKHDLQPDFQGGIKISDDLLDAIRNGEELQLSAWKKKRGEEMYLSLSVSKPYKPENLTPRASPPSLDDGEAPF
jgi:hypothetical protein